MQKRKYPETTGSIQIREKRNKLDIARAVCKGVGIAGRERQRQKEAIESSEAEREERIAGVWGGSLALPL